MRLLSEEARLPSRNCSTLDVSANASLLLLYFNFLGFGLVDLALLVVALVQAIPSVGWSYRSFHVVIDIIHQDSIFVVEILQMSIFKHRRLTPDRLSHSCCESCDLNLV